MLIRSRRTAWLGRLGVSIVIWSHIPAVSEVLADTAPQATAPDVTYAQPASPGLGLSRWINPTTAPFIPVPVVGVDPNSGTTLGILPTWIHNNDKDQISRIIAPDFVHNPNFGYGAHGRIFDYPSENEQWSVVAGLQQRVERLLDAEYQTELSRQQRWSFNYSLLYDRDGTPRFFGIGNQTQKDAETNYTKTSELAQIQIGLNLTHEWQLIYAIRAQHVDVTPGTLSGIATLASRFPQLPGIGDNHALSNRLAISYDTRDNIVAPRQGMQWVLYGGVASRNGLFNDSLYTEAGLDGRSAWAISPVDVLVAHTALRYMLSVNQVPFWTLSGLGGDRAEIGGDQPLRGYGAGRFYDRDSFSSGVEMRHTMLSFDASSTHIDVEVTPFFDIGRVFAKSSTFPLAHLHDVGGIGFRGVARPFIVGYVDIGYGGEGAAAFTGINYPF